VLRVLGTILILVFALFLVLAGCDDKQIAPVLGLLGTVAGYLLGRSEGGDAAPGAPDRGRAERGRTGRLNGLPCRLISSPRREKNMFVRPAYSRWPADSPYLTGNPNKTSHRASLSMN
jgi:hypothetical protein